MNYQLKKIHIVLLTLTLFTSCGVSRKAVDKDFYAVHSKKLGVQFTGNEDKKLIEAVEGWLGVPYKWAGNTKKGVDCSGLICQLYKEAYNTAVPRSTSEMVKKMSTVRKNKLQCGDVVFFTIKEKKVSHVGMYLADNQFVHASSSKGVRISNLDEAYWKKYYAGSGRLPNAPTPVPAQQNKRVKSDKAAKTTANKPSPPAKSTKDERKKSATPAPSASPVNAASPQQNTSAQKLDDDVVIVFDEEF
ncbi:hypothetical protein FACS189452_02290 [Bacteroidia bacterium]|nr:hypothetical protein FACS189452_02290 [Bacteroidia bacterium]